MPRALFLAALLIPTAAAADGTLAIETDATGRIEAELGPNENIEVSAEGLAQGGGESAALAMDQVVTLTRSAPDFFGLGQTVRVEAPVQDNAFVVAQTMALDGVNVGGDLFFFGDQLELNGDVNGDLYFFGSSLSVPEGRTVGGNLYVGAGSLEMYGTVNGSVHAGVGRAEIDGTVLGDVLAQAGQLSLGPAAVVHGDMEYTAGEEARLADGAQVVGANTFTLKPLRHDHEVHVGGDEQGLGGKLLWTFLFFIAALIAGSALQAVAPGAVRRPMELLDDGWGPALAVGFLVLVGVPTVSLLASLLVFPIPLAAIAIVVLLVGMYLARFVVAAWLGQMLLARTGRPVKPFGAIVLGLAVLYALSLVPVVSPIVKLLTVLLGLGSMAGALWRHKRAAAEG